MLNCARLKGEVDFYLSLPASGLYPKSSITVVKSFEILNEMTSCVEEESLNGGVSGDK